MEKSEFNRLFGEYVRYRREVVCKWKQNDLAIRMDKDYQNISRMERGEVTPTGFWIYNLAQAFEIPTSELWKGFEDFVEQDKKLKSGKNVRISTK